MTLSGVLRELRRTHSPTNIHFKRTCQGLMWRSWLPCSLKVRTSWEGRHLLFVLHPKRAKHACISFKLVIFLFGFIRIPRVFTVMEDQVAILKLRLRTFATCSKHHCLGAVSDRAVFNGRYAMTVCTQNKLKSFCGNNASSLE